MSKSVRRTKQHQDYNNVFQENLNEISEMLLREVFKLDVLHTKALKIKKIHRTLYRDPDLLLAKTNAQGEHLETLHGEVHLKDESEISYRAVEYAALELREFRKPVRLFILYIGKGKAQNILSELDGGCLQAKVTVVNIQDIPYDAFLRSGKAEEAILGILGSFGQHTPEAVVREIVGQIRQLNPEHERLKKYFKQLEILSNLRNLQPIVLKQLSTMPITYDLTTDIRYQQGIEKGIEKGIDLKTRLFVERLLEIEEYDNAKIALLADVTLEYVQYVKKELADKKQSSKNGSTVNGTVPK